MVVLALCVCDFRLQILEDKCVDNFQIDRIWINDEKVKNSVPPKRITTLLRIRLTVKKEIYISVEENNITSLEKEFRKQIFGQFLVRS